ncbi:MAG: thioredoxin domain-containing protein [Candidatus Nanohaloarchaea archaeon]
MAEEFECEECGRSFDTKRGLASHRRQAHEEGEEGSMASITITGLPALATVLVIGALIGFSMGTAFSGNPAVPAKTGQQSITDRVDGVSSDKIASLMEENRDSLLQEIRTDMREAQSVGVSATPGFIIYGKDGTGENIMGAQPYQNFASVIDAQKNGAGGNISVANVSTVNEPYIGSKSAPVTMVYWFDYQCPFCGRFEKQTLPRLKENYVKQGELRIVFKDFPFLGKDSRTAALASGAVWNKYPEKWPEWHATVFDNQGRENSGWASREKLVG